jgi:pre-rRNA-processing protein TSR1
MQVQDHSFFFSFFFYEKIITLRYERFLPSGASSMSMASFYAPITVAPCSVTLFKLINNVPVLVASGTLRCANADLLLIKKIVLTAHPARVHKRTAVCKGMFFFPADVRWFKPVSLWSKEGNVFCFLFFVVVFESTCKGRVGHIKESNGTKGAFKAVFDGQLNNSDTVCMSLYKRVFPEWQFSNFYGKI